MSSHFVESQKKGLPEKPFLDHVEDLRWVIIKIISTLLAFMILAFAFTKPLLVILQYPLEITGHTPKNLLRVLGVIDPFSIQINIALTAGIIFSFPFLLYFISKFILPALHPSERKWLLPSFIIGGVLFLIGISFAYFVILPQALSFFLNYNAWFNIETSWTLQNYLAFVTQIILSTGLIFELPVVMIFLNLLGILSSALLASKRRIAVLLTVVAAACITPTSDPYTLLLFGLPMYLLYEICIFATRFIEKRRKIRK